MGHSRVISVVEFAIVGIVVAFVVHWGGEHLQILSLRTWHMTSQNSLCEKMERETGIEPATSSLGSWRSTAELLPLILYP